MMRRLIWMASVAALLAVSPAWADDGDAAPTCAEQCQEEQVMCEEACELAEDAMACMAECRTEAGICLEECE